MKIEQRAAEYHQSIIDKNPNAEAWGLDEAYIQGATDQKKIDIEKACEWLRISEIANFSESQIKFFKKAMENKC